MSIRLRGARTTTLSFAAIALTIAFVPRLATAATLLRMDKYDIDKLETKSFELPRRAHIEIEAVGARPRWGDGFSAYAWILNATTREVVWSQDESSSSRVDDERLLRRSKEDLDLEPGRYELYTWAGSNWSLHGVRIHVADWGDWSRKWRDDDHHDKKDKDWSEGSSERELRGAARKCWVEVRSNELSDVQTSATTGEIPGAFYSATKLGDEAYVHAALTVDRPVDVRVYAIGEVPRGWDDGIADGGWIVNSATRERVWEMRRRDTRPAGGSEKNRVFDDEVHLEKGNYVLYYGTDDSHSWGEFNAGPPYDPMNWGVTLLAGKNFDATAVHVSDKYERGQPLVALTQLRDQEYEDRPFHLSRAGEVQVFAIGEYDYGSNEFADYGWITKQGDRDVVWEMTRRNTDYAGGASKNRMFDGSIKLEAGDYVLHYETDDSHSYRDWNADRPFEPESWGITLYPGANLSTADFQLLPETKGKPVQSANTLASIVEVGDNEHERATFKLERRSKIHIYALGEGERQRMYDAAWIENRDNGDTVWEMTYRNTDHAGGAHKNRVFNDDITLDAGTYQVHYETDGSHSFPDWNASRPRDPRSWGVTISLAETQ